MNHFPLSNTAQCCWLFDAGALNPPELDQLRQAPSIRFVYDHLKDDERGQLLGPVLVGHAECSNHVAKILSSDHQRHWAVHQWHFQGSWEALMHHTSRLRYLQTWDGQRYYLRFADSRCLPAIWSVLGSGQQEAMLGPITAWHYLDRQGQSSCLPRVPSDRKTIDACMADAGLKLKADQLGALLDLMWPDQLLSSVLEESPDLARDAHSSILFDLSSLTCAWLHQAREERYPIQKALLGSLLADIKAHGSAESVHRYLAHAHAALQKNAPPSSI